MNEHDATSTPILLKKRLKYAGDVYAILVTHYGWTNEAAIELLDKCPAVVECETELALKSRFELGHRMGYDSGYEEGYGTGYEAGYKAAKAEIVQCKDCRHYIGCGIYDGKSVHACSYMRTMKSPYDFCSSGERRKEDANE